MARVSPEPEAGEALRAALTAARKAQCHLLLEPPELRHYRPLGYKRGPELFDIGYRYTMSQAAALAALL